MTACFVTRLCKRLTYLFFWSYLSFFVYLTIYGKRRTMINGFEDETAPLSAYEKEVLLPVMVKCLSTKIGKEMAVTNGYMCERMEERNYDIAPPRVRKIINHIRVNDLISCLMATHRGYYITKDPREMEKYIESLKGREDAIREVREAMTKQWERMKKDLS